jgi:DNA topoisomerase-1
MKKKPDTLIIVESPSKAKTINKYLKGKYLVLSSVGHVIDLPKSRLAIDVENKFKPEYITIRGKAKVLTELKKQAVHVKKVLLATDPDREGEAISWHLANALSPKNDNIMRIEFNEITESAVREAIRHPREINLDLVNAQQARRILDRLVGYYISPLLWKKIKKGLSAGRVQSVTLKVICEREKEIDEFNPVEYWSLDAELKHKTRLFKAALSLHKGEKVQINNKAEVDEIIKDLDGKEYIVKEVKNQKRKRKANAPYITSKLQQEASNRLGFNTLKTMIIAQQLYEGIDIKNEGPAGLITYMRTDSSRVSDTALEKVRNYIAENYDPEYLPNTPNYFRNKKNAQDAHEAIRPTNVDWTPTLIKGDLTKDQFKLYELIWNKFVASQMTPETSELVSVSIGAGDYTFRCSGSKVSFKGFTIIDRKSKTEKSSLPLLTEGEVLEFKDLLPEQHFTTPPPRFNDASLVKFLEDSGIGRPSTYAPTINTLIKRYYINRSGKQLVPTILGKLINDIMMKHFTYLVSIDFTAQMESKLDLVEESKFDWVQMLEDFFGPFKDTVEKAEEKMEEMKGILDEETDMECELCGNKMVKRLGKFGFFLACSGFPDCKNAKSIPLGKCPTCENGDVVKRSTKKGRGGSFYACNNYPDCEFFTRETPAGKDCPKCGKLLFKRKLKGKKGEKNICLNESCKFEIDLLDDQMTENQEA